MANNLFPVFLKLEELHVLVVGGGNIALEKLKAILENSPQTKIRLVSPQVKIETELFALQFDVDIIREEFAEHHLAEIQLAIVATDNREISVVVKELAARKNILVNVADTPSLCDFYLSSVVRKGDLKLAISTNGKSPTMAKRLKEVFDLHLPQETNDAISQLHVLRSYLKGNFKEKVIELNRTTEVLIKQKSSIGNQGKLRSVFGFFLN